MIQVIEPLEIELDRKRSMLLNHAALFRAEREINRMRGAKPDEFAAIDYLMVLAGKKLIAGTGGFPRDLTAAVLWASLLHEEPTLTIENTMNLIGQSPLNIGEIVDKIWDAYEQATVKAPKEQAGNGEDQRPLAPSPGSISGGSVESS